MSHPREFSPLSRGAMSASPPDWPSGGWSSAPIRPITGRPSLRPSSCTGPPSGRLAVTPTRLPPVLPPRDPSAVSRCCRKARRPGPAYRVPLVGLEQNPLGPVRVPEAAAVRVWNRSPSHNRASYLLVQACQVRLACSVDGTDDCEHVLTVGFLPLALIAANLPQCRVPHGLRRSGFVSGLPTRRSSGVAKRAA